MTCVEWPRGVGTPTRRRALGALRWRLGALELCHQPIITRPDWSHGGRALDMRSCVLYHAQRSAGAGLCRAPRPVGGLVSNLKRECREEVCSAGPGRPTEVNRGAGARPVIGTVVRTARAELPRYRSVYRYASRLARAGAATLPPRGGARDAVAGPRKRVADGRNVITYVTTPSRLHRSTQEQITSPECLQKPERRPGKREGAPQTRNRNYTIRVAPRSTEITQPSARPISITSTIFASLYD